MKKVGGVPSSRSTAEPNASRALGPCDTFKLRGTPKARVTNRPWKWGRGLVNSLKGRNTIRDVTMDNPQPSS